MCNYPNLQIDHFTKFILMAFGDFSRNIISEFENNLLHSIPF